MQISQPITHTLRRRLVVRGQYVLNSTILREKKNHIEFHPRTDALDALINDIAKLWSNDFAEFLVVGLSFVRVAKARCLSQCLVERRSFFDLRPNRNAEQA